MYANHHIKPYSTGYHIHCNVFFKHFFFCIFCLLPLGDAAALCGVNESALQQATLNG